MHLLFKNCPRSSNDTQPAAYTGHLEANMSGTLSPPLNRLYQGATGYWDKVQKKGDNLEASKGDGGDRLVGKA